MLREAVSYLNAALAVLPLDGKMPKGVKTWSFETAIRGRVETDEDAAQLAGILAGATGIGLPIPPHMVVIDIDGEAGAVQWRELVGDEFIPETPVAKTGRGLHLWFATPREHQGSRKLGPKLDLKGWGGYVAAPPSKHPDGHRYEWLVPLVNEDGFLGPLAWLPEPIERLLDVAAAIDADFAVERPVYTLYQLSLQNGAWRLRREVCPPPIDGLLEAVATAPEGNRNNMLAWAVLQARDEGLKLEDAMREFGGAAAKAGLTPEETRTTIRSAYRRSRRP